MSVYLQNYECFFLRSERREWHTLFQKKEYLFREKQCGTAGRSQNLNYAHFLWGRRLGEEKDKEDTNAGL